MNADDAQFGEVAGDRIERDWLADAAAAMLLRIDHGLPDLHLYRDVEFDALGVEGVILRMIGRQFEPVRIQVCADKTEILHCIFEFAYTIHAHERVNADQSGEMFRMRLHGIGDYLGGHVITAGQAGASRFRGDQEAMIDTGRCHALDHFFERQACHQAVLGLHLADEEIIAPVGPV